MKFKELMGIVSGEPLFRSSLLLAGNVDRGAISSQLSRWVRAGKILQLRRGLYTLAPPYRKVAPHPFVVANHLLGGSYVSLESALQWAGHLPEEVSTVTSVTTGRPCRFETPLGSFLFRHLAPGYFFGFEKSQVIPGQEAFVAFPEKALLDIGHLVPGADQAPFLDGLRLQALEDFDTGRLRQFANRLDRPKLFRFADRVAEACRWEQEEYQEL
jgi:predicted transcriptional regulator of viral defense system